MKKNHCFSNKNSEKKILELFWNKFLAHFDFKNANFLNNFFGVFHIKIDKYKILLFFFKKYILKALKVCKFVRNLTENMFYFKLFVLICKIWLFHK